MEEMTGLVTSNPDLVYNALSFTTATLGIAFVYFLVSRNRVSPAYRSAVTMSAMICGIAAYHYWRMFTNFAEGTWNEGYRYADWLLTVPLLVAELVVVSGVSKAVAKKVTPRLVVGALLMIATGYPGEVAEFGSTSRTVSRYSAASRKPRPTPEIIRCRIWTAPSAFPPRMPTMPASCSICRCWHSNPISPASPP